MFEYLIIGWALVLGALMGHGVARAASRRLVESARRKAAASTEEAKELAAQRVRESGAQAKEEAFKLLKHGEEQEKQYRDENAMLKERIERLETKGDEKESDLLTRQQRLEILQTEVAVASARARDVRDEAKALQRNTTSKLEERAGTSSGQVRQGQIEALVAEEQASCADRLRNLEATDSERFSRQAKRLMGIALGRYTGGQARERVSTMVHFKPEEAALLADNAAWVSIIEEGTGVRLAMGETGESLRLEGGDGVAREHGRRCLARFLGGKKPVEDPAQEVEAIGEQLTKDLRGRGRKAFKVLGLKPAHDEIVMLVGRLTYRTSYTQNQWEHAIEAAFLGGLMASELGLDVTLARRSTLLHDIGKALTHQVEGSHAVIGAEIARRCGEDELICNAIGAHHGDEPMNSPYAPLVAASDAMSGARPGARREMVESYVDRVGDLERLARHFKGVNAVHAVQAGREIRVHVDENKVSDARADELSAEIAAKISDQVTFPGQIRIIVIREFKAVELAG